MEQKIVLPDDTMERYVSLKKDIEQNPQFKLRILQTRNECFYQEFIAYTEEYIRYYYAEYQLYFTELGKPFLKSKHSQSFKLQLPSCKISDYNMVWKNKKNVITQINNLLNVEWFHNFINSPNYRHINLNIFYNKKILTKVWKKEITNPEQLIKYFIKSQLHTSNITWKNIRNLLAHDAQAYGIFNFQLIRIIDKWVINPNEFIVKLIDNTNNFSKILDYRDYLYQLVVLRQRSNIAKWSYKRFLLEHEKNTMALMEGELEQKSKSIIFDNEINSYLPKNITCSFINSEYLAFKESQLMHHCLYTNYWNSIEALKYFAISINDEHLGRYTVGITTNYKNEFIIDQIRGVRNADCPSEVSTLFHQWINDNQELFLLLQKSAPNTIQQEGKFFVPEILNVFN